jgi:hypothetical protein
MVRRSHSRLKCKHTCPLVEPGFHFLARFWPLSAALGQYQVPFGECGAAAVDLVEDVHYDVNGFIVAGHLFNAECTPCSLRHFLEKRVPEQGDRLPIVCCSMV